MAFVRKRLWGLLEGLEAMIRFIFDGCLQILAAVIGIYILTAITLAGCASSCSGNLWTTSSDCSPR